MGDLDNGDLVAATRLADVPGRGEDRHIVAGGLVVEFVREDDTRVRVGRFDKVCYVKGSDMLMGDDKLIAFMTFDRYWYDYITHTKYAGLEVRVA